LKEIDHFKFRRKWERGIKMDLKETGWGTELDRSGSGSIQMAVCFEYENESSGYQSAGKFLTR
jgi:hypothetical protein